MKKLLIILLLTTSFFQAQNKSLFWEISGNDLTKNSYEIAKVVNLKNLSKNDSISFQEKEVIEKNGREISFYFTHSKQRTPEFESDKNKLYRVAFINENKR